MPTGITGLKDRVAIVSGIGPGLGASTARLLARAGARVVLAARSEDRLEALRSELTESGAEAVAIRTDLSDPAQAARLAERGAEAFGGIDVVIHNAFSAVAGAEITKSNFDDWRRIFDVNLFGALTLSQACAPHQEKAAAEHGDAAVVFVTSMAMRKLRVGEGAYAVSKGALHTAVKMLALELGPKRVRVNAVAPGWIDGPSVDAHISFDAKRKGVSKSAIRDGIEAHIPLGNRMPTSDDIAGSVFFLASPLAIAVTGQTLDANGGEYLGQ